MWWQSVIFSDFGHPSYGTTQPHEVQFPYIKLSKLAVWPALLLRCHYLVT